MPNYGGEGGGGFGGYQGDYNSMGNGSQAPQAAPQQTAGYTPDYGNTGYGMNNELYMNNQPYGQPYQPYQQPYNPTYIDNQQSQINPAQGGQHRLFNYKYGAY